MRRGCCGRWRVWLRRHPAAPRKARALRARRPVVICGGWQGTLPNAADRLQNPASAEAQKVEPSSTHQVGWPAQRRGNRARRARSARGARRDTGGLHPHQWPSPPHTRRPPQRNTCPVQRRSPCPPGVGGWGVGRPAARRNPSNPVHASRSLPRLVNSAHARVSRLTASGMWSGCRVKGMRRYWSGRGVTPMLAPG